MTGADRAAPGLDDGPLAEIASGAIGPAIEALGPGHRLVLVGLDRHRLAEALRAVPGSLRSALMLAPADVRGPPAIVQRLLDDLAVLALARWPDWAGQGSGPWLRAASRLAAGGRAPRLRRCEPAIEFDGLRRAVDPNGLVLVAEIDPAAPRRARAMVEVLEWCAARGTATVAALAHRPPSISPYDRLLYGARAVRTDPEPLVERFFASPHPASLTELRVKQALDRDAELGPLFACNQLVTDAGARPPRVDLLWRDGRVVVEFDGPEHQASLKFADDRHRDYELLVAGYHVLRITNDQVAMDLARAIEKIRAVVRFRRRQRTAT